MRTRGCQDDWPDDWLVVELAVTGAERRPLAVLLAANVISITGSSLTLMGVPWFVLQSTGSAADAGVVAFCAMLPAALAALAGGPVVDRVGRRRVSVVSDLVCGAAVGAVPLLAAGGVYLLVTLCPAIFPAWRQLDRPAQLPAGAGQPIAAGPVPAPAPAPG
jgi:MFS family permease